MPSGNDGIREASRIVEADAAADRAHHDRCGDADLGADPPANRSANRRTEECEGAAHRVTPEECVSEVTNDERPTHPSYASWDSYCSLSLATTAGSASVVVSPNARPSAMSRRSRRMILPERVLGKSALNRMSSGLASAPILSATWSRSSSRSSGDDLKPSRRVTNAASAWPFNSCWRPTTADSATAGCDTSADSTSIVPMRWPATLSTSSTRPRIQKYESSSRFAPSPGKYRSGRPGHLEK